MKNKLTSEDVKKLLEMSKYYYRGSYVFITNNEYVSIDYINMHWFQFIVYELASKVYGEVDIHTPEYIWCNVLAADDPIDDLYKMYSENRI